MRNITLFHLIFWCLGVLFLGLSFYFTAQYKTFREQGMRVTGVVIRLSYGKADRTAPVVEYMVDRKMYIYEHLTTTSSNTYLYPVGSTAELLYLPASPEKSILKETADNMVFGKVMIPMSLLFILIPFISLAARKG